MGFLPDRHRAVVVRKTIEVCWSTSCLSSLSPLGAGTGVCGAGRSKQSHRGCSRTQAAFTADKGTSVAPLMLQDLWHNTAGFYGPGLFFRVMKCFYYSNEKD